MLTQRNQRLSDVCDSFMRSGMFYVRKAVLAKICTAVVCDIVGAEKIVALTAKHMKFRVQQAAINTGALAVGLATTKVVDTWVDRNRASLPSCISHEGIKIALGTTLCAVTQVAGAVLVGGAAPTAGVALATGFLAYGIERTARFAANRLEEMKEA